MTKQDIARKFKAELPAGTSQRKIASAIWNSKQGALFPNYEAVRSTVRIIHGSIGKRLRKETPNKENFSQTAWEKVISEQQDCYQEDKPTPALINHKKYKKLLILSDLHIPFHDPESVIVAIKKGKKEKCDAVLLNGDFMDCYASSRFQKDPSKRNFKLELSEVKKILKVLRDQFKGCPIYYKFGNHEKRHEDFLITHCDMLYGFQEFHLHSLLTLKEFDIEYIKHDRLIQFGKLPIIHGHELGKGIFSPVNAARGLYLKTKVSCLCGHHHVTSQHNEKDLQGKVTVTWTTGALCKLYPEYARFNKWNSGFAIVEILDSEGNFKVDNMSIINGQIA